ncbi:plant UBX domain-containing protein 9 isoform X2 [Carica papaya]|uniref:plant UBX domain-containing protein 9 isoform X2 n=1 Tax=Carica papaya TaxID=3649 RepID=UPI000B8C86A4|nr:plant UBX domain-containing protein 9 isoform X2 [Carica papaya]
MARPTRDAIDAYMSITGASESLALQKLEEYGGNLSDAVNAHFGEVEGNIRNSTSAAFPQDTNMDNQNQIRTSQQGLFPLLSAARSFRPSLLLDPSYRRNLLNQIAGSVFVGRPAGVLDTREQAGFPVESSRQNELHSPLGPRHATEDVTRVSPLDGPDIHRDVMRDDESHMYGNSTEEEMIQAAIEASKKESSVIGLSQRRLQQEDDELARALSLSLMTMELEKEKQKQEEQNQYCQLGVYDSRQAFEKKNSKWKPGSSSIQHGTEEVEEQRKSNHSGSNPQHAEDLLYSVEWGSISSKELDEAVMLETALFGKVPEGTSSHLHTSHRQNDTQRSRNIDVQSGPCSPSQSLMEQRQLQEKQDNEYLASLLTERDKEMNASKEAETKVLGSDREELERWLAMKEASLPQEPKVENDDAVALLVRMPNGNRLGRRFLKSDRLEHLFDFLDVSRVVKPGTYRVVTPYPRRAFSIDDSALSLNELGLASKQEVLFLELI